eukprot:scaffold5392_cov15-Tisochrysis_lutea.AAC.1
MLTPPCGRRVSSALVVFLSIVWQTDQSVREYGIEPYQFNWFRAFLQCAYPEQQSTPQGGSPRRHQPLLQD